MGGGESLRESDIIFSSATNDIKTALSGLKRSNLSITNRLRSIKQDADFVHNVAQEYKLPLVANERCGSWYIHPETKIGSAYFKSTDGHFGQWSFSLRRLNLQILDIIGLYGDCIIVDSTRRGKSMPDALSKTIPIWICVLNRLLFPQRDDACALQTPNTVVSPSEHAQIEARVSGFVRDLIALELDLVALRTKLVDKPMKPVWVTPSTNISDLDGGHARTEDGGSHRVVLCTASSRESEDMHATSFDYVQGAADDSESWACRLVPEKFWAHKEELLATSEDDLPAHIQRLTESCSQIASVRSPVLVRPTGNIFISNNSSAEKVFKDFQLVISSSTAPIAALARATQCKYVHFACAPGKNGSRQLRKELPKLRELAPAIGSATHVLVTCQTGRDLAVGVALALICMFIQDNGARRTANEDAPAELNKSTIRHRLSWIMVSMPDAAPSRATLQSVNAFLLS